MLPFLAVGGYYSSPTNDLGEKGRFSSIIGGVWQFILTYWIYFLIFLLLLLLLIVYYIYRKTRKKIEETSLNNTSNTISHPS